MTETIVWEWRAVALRWRGRRCADRHRERMAESHLPGRHRSRRTVMA